MRLLRPIFWPRVRTLSELPQGILQVGVYGAISGPVFGYCFVWLFQPKAIVGQPLPPGAFTWWLAYAARMGIMYVLTYYTLYLIADYVQRRYEPRGVWSWILYISGWTLAILVSALISPGAPRFGDEFRRMWYGNEIRIIVVAMISMMLVRHIRLKLERAKAEKAAAEALSQVKALQAQINPHFFFNTLNTIYALIAVDPQAAQRTVSLLAEMSRHAFATAQSDLIPLAQELDFVKAYLEIEKVRFGKRLQCEMPDIAKADGIRLPALVVQPLIENAIRHGISKRLEGGNLALEINRDDKQFSLTVRNDCEVSSGRFADAFFCEGHALDNIRKRLQLHYGDRALLSVAFPNADTVAVTLKGPLQ
jgi:hypothetical protein